MTVCSVALVALQWGPFAGADSTDPPTSLSTVSKRKREFPQPSDEAVTLAAEHVGYEVYMLAMSVHGLSLDLPTDGHPVDSISWALLECHLLHQRALIEFLTRVERHRGRDVLIADFRIPGDWPIVERPVMRGELLNLKDGIDGYMAHITFARAEGPPPLWDSVAGVAIAKLVLLWSSSCPDGLPWSDALHDDVQVLAQGSTDLLVYHAERPAPGTRPEDMRSE